MATDTPMGNVPLFPAKAAGLPAAFFDAVRTGEGGRGPFWKKVSLPPSRSPHPPKNFYAGLWQALMPHRPFCFPRSPGDMPKNMDGRARHPHDGGRPQDGRHSARPSPSGLFSRCPCRMPQNGCPFQKTYYPLQNTPAFLPFCEEGHDSRPAGQRRRPTISTRTKVLRGDGGTGEEGRFFQKRPSSPGLASPEARYHAHVRSSPDCGIRP